MERVNAILRNNNFLHAMEVIDSMEKEREFCRHNIEHLLSVGRIAYLLNLENGYGFDKEIIYAAALLHDIGRSNSNDKDHHTGGLNIIVDILKQTQFDEVEIYEITDAIASHRMKDNDKLLNVLIYKADKWSRNCFLCPVRDACYWDDEKKNKIIRY